MIVDCALYERGERRPGTVPLANAKETAEAADGFVWFGTADPTMEEFGAIATEFELPPLAVEDAVEANQRPKAEEYGHVLFFVMRPVTYDDAQEHIEDTEIQLFVDGSYLITVRHGHIEVLREIRKRVEADPQALLRGPYGALHAILDRVVDDYEETLVSLESDVDEVEAQVFDRSEEDPVERIYHLERQVLRFAHAAVPLAPAVEDLAEGRIRAVPAGMHDQFRDVHDHLQRVQGRLHALREILDNALQANLAQIAIRQNEDMRKISAWVAIAAVPTAISAIYGMNFEHMPELKLRYGYPVVLFVMASACLFLYRRFKHVGWL